MLRFRLASSFAVLCAPAIASLILWLILRSLTGADTSAVPLAVSRCAAFDVYSQLGGGGACLTLGYAPKGDVAADAVATALASAAGWSMGTDVVGYTSAAEMAGAFYDNPLRQVDFAVVIDASAGADKVSYTCVLSPSCRRRRALLPCRDRCFFFALSPQALDQHVCRVQLRLCGLGRRVAV